MRNTPAPESIVLSNAVPHVAEALQELRSHQMDMSHFLQQEIGSLRTTGEEKSSRIENLVVNQIYNLRSDLSRGHSQAAAMLMSTGNRTEEPSSPHSTTAETGSDLVGVAPLTLPPPALDAGHSMPPNPPAVKMNRKLCTVPDAWKEYDIGLGSNPALRVLEETYKAAWRSKASESKFFRRRLPLYRAITLVRDSKLDTLPEILRRLQTVLERCPSLRQFCDKLKEVLELEGVTGCNLLGRVEQLFIQK